MQTHTYPKSFQEGAQTNLHNLLDNFFQDYHASDLLSHLSEVTHQALTLELEETQNFEYARTIALTNNDLSLFLVKLQEHWERFKLMNSNNIINNKKN